MSALERLIASLSRGVLMRALWRVLPTGGARGLVVAVVALVAYFVASAAHAVGACPGDQIESYPPVYSVGGDSYQPSAAAYCGLYNGYQGITRVTTETRPDGTFTCRFFRMVYPEGENSPPPYETDAGSVNGSASPGPLVCTSPPPATCERGKQSVGVSIWSIPSLTSFLCHEGCGVRARAAADWGSDKPGASRYTAWGPFQQTGETCDGTKDPIPTPKDEASPAPQKDKPGYCPGTVNGVSVSVPCSRVAAGTETVTSASGQASAPGSPASSSSTGTTRRETICTSDGTCLETITRQDSTTSGGTEKTENGKSEEIKDQKSFCEENPGLSICLDGAFGGSCSSGFTCKGDAIQCAIARQSYESSCKIHGENAMSAIGLAAAAASAPELPASSALFSLGDRLSEVPIFGTNGGCPSDSSVAVLGVSVALPFSQMCDSLHLVGQALKGLALLVAGFIVFRRSA